MFSLKHGNELAAEPPTGAQMVICVSNNLLGA